MVDDVVETMRNHGIAQLHSELSAAFWCAYLGEVEDCKVGIFHW